MRFALTSLFRNWRKKRQERRAQIAADARDLIARYGANAYIEARLRASEEGTIDGNRPPGHWREVRNDLAKLLSPEGGRDWGGYVDD